MNETERLSPKELEHLEWLLVGQRAPVVQRFQRPATPKALAEVESYLGLPLPNELRQWWEWHDGTDVKPHERAVRGLIGPSFQFLGTGPAIKFSQEMRNMALEDVPEEPDATWAANWLAISSDGPVACRCDVASDAPVPVLDVDYHHTSTPGAVVAQSLGEMVRWWIEALEAGVWVYEPEHDWWERRHELVPPERDRTGLV